jgi:hypothetical protein
MKDKDMAERWIDKNMQVAKENPVTTDELYGYVTVIANVLPVLVQRIERLEARVRELEARDA